MLHMLNEKHFQVTEATMTEERFYSVQEVAQRYNVTTQTIRRWIDGGLFPGTVKQNPLTDNSPFVIPQSGIEHYETLRNASSRS